MNKGHQETISIDSVHVRRYSAFLERARRALAASSVRLVSCAFMVLALAVFKPFGLEVWQWQAYIHLLSIFALGLFSCFLTEVILRFFIQIPRSYDRSVSYIIRRNLWFQCINTPLVSLLICLYRHFAMSSLVKSNKLSLSNYFETLLIIAFLSFAIGLYWRFKFRSRYLAIELEETRLLNEQLKKLQASPNPSKGGENHLPATVHSLTLTGTTNEHVTLEISNLLYIEAVGNYVKVCQLQHNKVHTNMLRATMKQMEDTLQVYPAIVRCHRAFMVNLGQVEQISSNSRTMQLVMLHSHDTIPVSRSNVNKLKKFLGGSHQNFV